MSNPVTAAIQDRWFAAVANNGWSDVAALIRQGASCAWTTVREQSALHLAIEHGHEPLATFLMGVHLAQGVELDLENRQGHTPLGVAIDKHASAVVQRLLESGAAATRSVRFIGKAPANAWLAAAHVGATPILRVLSTHAPEIIDTALGDGRTALHLATAGGHEAALTWLLRQNIDHARTDNRGRPAWASASTPGVLTVWENAVGAAVLAEPLDDAGTLLHAVLASPSGADSEVLEWMLARLPELIHRPDATGRTPLQVALTHKNIAAVDALSAAGASWHTVDAQGQTPLLKLDALAPWPPVDAEAAWRAAAAAQRWQDELPPAPSGRTGPRL